MVDIFTDPGVTDPADWTPGERKHYFDRYREHRGWGILTPEDTLLCFLKRRIDPNIYRANKYYSTIASIPEFDSGVVEHLALLAYDNSYGQEDEEEDRQQWFKEIGQKVLSNNLHHFIRIPADYPRLIGS
jgi:hypothetical protein